MVEPATAFVREVVRPGGPDAIPCIDDRNCRFALDARPSPIHRWGVFARGPIPARRRVIEYTGERIGLAEARRRSLRMHLYLFWIAPDRAIDGAIGGSGAEFINHGCEPNLVARLSRGRIHLVSLRRIAPGEELLYDYKVTGAAPLMPCHCGAPGCRGQLNRRDP